MTFTWEHVLYRFYDGDGVLLYVGITKSIRTRFKAHAKKQAWWPEVTGCRVEFHQDRAALLRAEHDAIKHERPRYNIRGAPAVATPATVAALARRRRRLRVSDDEWAWMNHLPPYDGASAA